MPNHKEFTSVISVDGQPLDEYRVVVEGNKVSCYIRSEPGKSFIVHWADMGSRTFTSGYILLDGQKTPGRFLGGFGETFRTGARSGPATERLFTFADIPKTTKSGASSSTVGKEVGTIELKIVQAQRGPERPANPLAILPSASSVSSEWIKKTGGHCATFSKEEVPYLPQAPMTWSSKPLDVDNPHSYVKFVFHYRTLEWLQEHGIVP
ncbi:hypothetical protein DFH11DRAFT_1467398, partial [Phellopilus nigrolimitatus]